MTQLFSTLSRAALVAIGLGFAASASAQTDYTFTCPTGYNTSVSGAGTSNVTVTCAPAGGGDVAPSCNAMTSTGGTALTDSGSGATTTLSVLCNGGSPTALTYDWTVPSGTKGACTTSGTVGQAATCAVSGITQGGQWKVVVSNGIGTPAQKTQNYTVQQGGGGSGEYALCSAAGVSVAQGFQYPARNVYTNQYGSLGLGEGLVFKMVLTSPRSGGGQWWGNYGGTKEWALTTTACDFTGNSTVQNQQGRGTTFSPNYNLPAGTYYFNVREVAGCGNGDCSMNGKLN
jgi:hypothetical protein